MQEPMIAQHLEAARSDEKIGIGQTVGLARQTCVQQQVPLEDHPVVDIWDLIVLADIYLSAKTQVVDKKMPGYGTLILNEQ